MELIRSTQTVVGHDGTPSLVRYFEERTMKSHSEAVAYGERSTTRICKCTGHEAPFHRAPAAVDVCAWRFSRAARRVTNYRHLAADLLRIAGINTPLLSFLPSSQFHSHSSPFLHIQHTPRLSQAMPPQKAQRPHSKKRSQDTRPYHCKICGRDGHSRKTCVSKSATTTTTRITITTTITTTTTPRRSRKHCSNCKMAGHQWQTCTSPRKPASAASNGDDDGDDDDNDEDSDVSDIENSERAAAVTTMTKKPPSRPRGKMLSADEKIDALRVYLECMEEKKRGPTVSTHNLLSRASRYVDVSKPVLERLYQFWSATGEVEPVLTRRGKYIRQKHECWARHWLTNIRETVRELNRDGMPTTINTIMAECGWVGEPLVEQAKKTSDGDY